METIVNHSATFFAGRERFLQELHTILQDNQLVVISAPAGMGKTAVALEYARRFSDEYQWIFRLDGANPETWLADSLELAERLALPVERGEQRLAIVDQALAGWFASHQNYLLILDNVSSMMRSATTERATGHVLLLTRKPVNDTAIMHCKLEKFEAHQGALILLHRAGLLSRNADLTQVDPELRSTALALAQEIDGFPLALHLAGASLQSTGRSAQQYLAMYHESLDRLVQIKAIQDRTTNAITITCGLSMIALRQNWPLAAELLWLCSTLASLDIPWELFTQGASELASTVQEAARTPALLNKNFTQLDAMGLLIFDEKSGILHMQPTIQEVLYRSQSAEQRRERVTQLLQAFSHLLRTQEQAPLPVRLRTIAHILHLANLSSDTLLSQEAIADTFAWAASQLWEQGLLQDAEVLLRRAFLIYERIRDLTDPQVATVLSQLATLNFLLKNYTSAETFAQRAVTASTRALGANHPDVLLALDTLGHIYAAQGKQREAQLCYEKAIATGEHTGLQDHPYFIAAMYDLALLFMKNDAYTSAEPWLRKVCAAWEPELKTQGSTPLEAWLALADISVKQENWRQAEVCYERVLPICEAVWGEESPVTLKSMEQAAYVSLHRKHIARAENYLLRVRNVRERILGTRHPAVASCLNGLAQVALAREQFDEASLLLEQAQSIYENRLEPEDLLLAEVLDNLAVVATTREQYGQAISMLQRSLSIREHILGEDHLGLVENLSNLATLSLLVKQPGRAEQLLLQALSIYQHTQRPEDLGLDAVLTNLATIAMERTRYWQAKMYLERSRAIRSLALGNRHPETAEVLQKLALIAVAEEAWEEAVQLFQRVLPIYREALGEQHPQTLECLEQLAATSVRLDRLEDAQEALQQVLHAREEQLGPEHLDLVGSLLALGQVCLFQKRYEEAQMYLQRVIGIYERHPDAQPFGAVLLFGSLTTALEEQGESEQAALLAQKAGTLTQLVLRAASSAVEDSADSDEQTEQSAD